MHERSEYSALRTSLLAAAPFEVALRRFKHTLEKHFRPGAPKQIPDREAHDSIAAVGDGTCECGACASSPGRCRRRRAWSRCNSSLSCWPIRVQRPPSIAPLPTCHSAV